ncbi:MAG: hypothetical protein JO169_15415 [Solirubrobacterales bacterium]|nr:hypothetical protein [Solirubrobacterales bacterium]
MAKTGQAKSALPYIQRLLEDEFVQEQLRSAVNGARAAYARARRQRGEAVDDKRLYGNLRQAASSTRNLTRALRPARPKPKRRVRKLATVALAIGGCAWLTMRLQRLAGRPQQD